MSRPACARAASSFPFPEEMNRRATSIVTRWHFAPTDAAADNLRREGITDGVEVTGNTVVDALRHIAELAPGGQPARRVRGRGSADRGHCPSPRILEWRNREDRGGASGRARPAAGPSPDLRDAPEPGGQRPGLCRPRRRAAGPGGHRARLCRVHRPATRARLAITDSGGVQEEGPTLGVPVLVTRQVHGAAGGRRGRGRGPRRNGSDRIGGLAVELLTSRSATTRWRARDEGSTGMGRPHGGSSTAWWPISRNRSDGGRRRPQVRRAGRGRRGPLSSVIAFFGITVVGARLLTRRPSGRRRSGRRSG